jgi:hypothetical protein
MRCKKQTLNFYYLSLNSNYEKEQIWRHIFLRLFYIELLIRIITIMLLTQINNA